MWPHELKLQRARQHLEELRAEVERWSQHGLEVTVEPVGAVHYDVKVRMLEPPNDELLAGVIGDFLHNARAALDHLAFALVEAGGDMDAGAAEAVGFPIVGVVDRDGSAGRGPDRLADAAKTMLARVTGPAQAAIERLQPYRTGGMAWAMEPLWILQELARFDRYRMLQVVAIAGEVELDVSSTRNVQVDKIEISRCMAYGRLFSDWDDEAGEAATTVARLIAHPVQEQRPIEVHVKDALSIGFDSDSLPPTIEHIHDFPVELTLASIDRAVRSAFEALAPYLAPRPAEMREDAHGPPPDEIPSDEVPF